MNIQYVSLGAHCYVSWTLRDTGLQVESLPMDWVASYDFRTVPGFLDDVKAERLGLVRSPLPVDAEHPNPLYSPYYNFRLPHEFDVDPSNSLSDIRGRYVRRLERLWRKVGEADFVFFLRTLNSEGMSEPEPVDTAMQGLWSFYDRWPELRDRSHAILFSTPAIENKPAVGDYPISVLDAIVPFEQGYIGKVSDYPFDRAETLVFYKAFLSSAWDHRADLAEHYRDVVGLHVRTSDTAAA